MKTKLNYNVAGIGKNIVLIHGWGVCANIWQNIANELSKSFRVIWFDLPGYGSNRELSDNHSLISICEKIVTIIPPQSILLGWSMGGLIASWFSIYYPRLVDKLIITNSSPCFVAKNNWPGIEPVILTNFKDALIKDPDRTMMRFLSLQTNARKESQFLRKNMFLKSNCSINTLTHGLNTLLSIDLRSKMQKLKLPMLLILGENDKLVPASISQFLSAHQKMQIEILPNANHIPFIFQPNYFLKIVTRFINAK